MAAEALRAVPAEPRQARHHVIARLHRRHVGAHRLDDTGALVAQHDRTVEREAALPIDDVQVAVAHARGRGADQHLTAPRLVDLDGLDRERLVHLAENGGLGVHASLLAGSMYLGITSLANSSIERIA